MTLKYILLTNNFQKHLHGPDLYLQKFLYFITNSSMTQHPAVLWGLLKDAQTKENILLLLSEKGMTTKGYPQSS